METILTDTIKSSMRILSKSAVIEQDINNSIAACKLDLQRRWKYQGAYY